MSGKNLRTERVPGNYTCYICRESIDSENFYRDRTRHNGCGSRCKKCDDLRTEARKSPVKQSFVGSFVGSVEALNAPRTKKRWTQSEESILAKAILHGKSAKEIEPEFPNKTIAMLQGKMGSMKENVLSKEIICKPAETVAEE